MELRGGQKTSVFQNVGVLEDARGQIGRGGRLPLEIHAQIRSTQQIIDSRHPEAYTTPT
jgi:hypothetical protein